MLSEFFKLSLVRGWAWIIETHWPVGLWHSEKQQADDEAENGTEKSASVEWRCWNRKQLDYYSKFWNRKDITGFMGSGLKPAPTLIFILKFLRESGFSFCPGPSVTTVTMATTKKRNTKAAPLWGLRGSNWQPSVLQTLQSQSDPPDHSSLWRTQTTLLPFKTSRGTHCPWAKGLYSHELTFSMYHTFLQRCVAGLGQFQWRIF